MWRIRPSPGNISYPQLIRRSSFITNCQSMQISPSSPTLAILRNADCCALHRVSQNMWKPQATLIHITIYTAKGYKIPLIWQLLGKNKMNITNLLFEILGEIQNCHPQGFTSGRKPRQYGGKEMQISQVPGIECEIHALDSLKLPVGKPPSNACSNQCRGFPVLLHVQNQFCLLSGVMKQKAEARGSK